MNSEEFRETFLRTTEKGPPRPSWRKRWRKTTPGIETREEEIRSRALQGQEKPPQSDQCDRLEEKGTTLLEKPRERQARVVKKKSKEKKQRVPRNKENLRGGWAEHGPRRTAAGQTRTEA